MTVDEHANTSARNQPATPDSMPVGRRELRASLSPSEVVTQALFGQWAAFPSERAFYRNAARHLRPAFPRLPTRRQHKRLLRRQHRLLVEPLRHLASALGAATCLYQVVNTTGLPTRHVRRHGVGWLPEYTTAIGYCNWLGWYQGFRLLTLATQAGVVTGFALAAPARNERLLAEEAFAAGRGLVRWLLRGGRRLRRRRLAGALGRRLGGVSDQPAQPQGPPSRPAQRPAYRRWLAGIRQIAEIVYARLMDSFGPARARPHVYDGFFARLTAKLALHDFCCRLNQQLGRPTLVFADLVDW